MSFRRSMEIGGIWRVGLCASNPFRPRQRRTRNLRRDRALFYSVGISYCQFWNLPTGRFGIACVAAMPRLVFVSMTADQILDEIKALPQPERQKLLQSVLRLETDDVPADFVEALDDFEHGRFVSMETALNEIPPGA